MATSYPANRGLYDKGTVPYMSIRAYQLQDTSREELAQRRLTNIIDKLSFAELVLPIPVEGLNTNEAQEWVEEVGITGAASGGPTAEILSKIANAEFAGYKAGARNIGQYQAINDLASLLYKSAQFRTFTFSWNLVPSNEQDARNILKICNTFRYLSHGSNNPGGSLDTLTNMARSLGPTSGSGDDPTITGVAGDQSGTFIKNPFFWRIGAYFGAKTLFASELAVITSVNVTRKGGDNAFKLHPDGGFPAVELQIEFKEMFKHTAESLQSLDSKYGVGTSEFTIGDAVGVPRNVDERSGRGTAYDYTKAAVQKVTVPTDKFSRSIENE